MGQDEDPLPLVRRTDFCRREQTRRRRVAQVPKLSQHGFKPKGDVTGDVFEKDPFRLAFGNDAGDLGPEVSGIAGTAAFAGGAEGLARIAGQQRVEGAAEWAGVEAAQIVPDRGRGEIPRGLRGNEHGLRPVVPFDEGAAVIAGFGEHEVHIQAAAAGAEGQSVSGT
nr:hypothetical protein [Paracoccus sp. (in: a-proteobacteria)]